MKRIGYTLRTTTLTLLTLLLSLGAANASWNSDSEIEIWLDEANGSVYQRGESVEINFVCSDDCYVAIYDIDTEGYIHLLYPSEFDRLRVRGGRLYTIPDPYDDYELVAGGPRGVEYIVAVSSPYPLALGEFDDLDYRNAGYISGDPSLAIGELNERLVWADSRFSPVGYASDIAYFYVGSRVPYPRYLVHNWHPGFRVDTYWDPYCMVDFFFDFHWDHRWCHSGWWRYGYHRRQHHSYWYSTQHGGPRLRWKSNYYYSGNSGPHKNHSPDRQKPHRLRQPRSTERRYKDPRVAEREKVRRERAYAEHQMEKKIRGESTRFRDVDDGRRKEKQRLHDIERRQRSSEKPRVEKPRSRSQDKPIKVDRPRKVDQPKKVEKPRKVDKPKKADQAKKIEKPKKNEKLKSREKDRKDPSPRKR